MLSVLGIRAHEAQIGGDLPTATRTDGGVRMIVGDVRVKGLAAVGESALLLSAFRLVAAQHATLPDLAWTLTRTTRSPSRSGTRSCSTPTA